MPTPEADPERHHHRGRTARPAAARPPARPSLRSLLRVASVACGIQFGWALQLSLLTPYVQELGIPHAWASIIWLCGPLSGLIVQPMVGHMSDRCTSRFGRRRPFIVAGAVCIAVSVLIIGYSADIGWLLGDRGGVRPRAIGVFVFGFWILDVANNMTQGPCRALLADLTGKDHRRTRVANAYFSLFMAVGNILGYATGAFSYWFKVFPFTLTSACDVNCANLKSAFIIDIAFIALTTYLSISAAQELPLGSSDRNAPFAEEGPGQSSQAEEAFLWELFGTFRYFSAPIWIILLVTGLNWIGWFPFLLFDTDWMGREIYGGKPNEGTNYSNGVRMGALGLMLNSIMLGITSVLMEKLCRKWGSGFVWGISNFIMALSFLAMLVITFVNKSIGHDSPPPGIVIASLVVFAILGIPLAITYSVPYALISSRIESLGLGQGLSMGVLNLAIVIPQVLVSLGSGPWDQLFGGGNSPAFAVAAGAALASGLVAILAIPRSIPQKPRSFT
ncbi:sucrose transport protein SUC4 [Rosa rugosa]|uniref:sucrose transport protein SUC4 n=1 Tax=Rosa rugosa TaxID=74645 RepID=UPI002B4158C9|nr:sucrose transport protein SUC4 [Rosa rugosa]XP_062026144.1 sucrose transport protein SUC4 [Rosa rugosa]XP_062026145.1 sucrose transport protein SUC4 [Rosa rugosa]XP_062026146.1 sucrose transport protein SUC4 [Rosa rugosa]XP_062026147.1 sucrose transport protein SUC4 [Rosa rugosa]XP_062026148.1 sucrose transport protein SUC4 [Rosa rugosa]